MEDRWKMDGRWMEDGWKMKINLKSAKHEESEKKMQNSPMFSG
jgi:hypothetical protein